MIVCCVCVFQLEPKQPAPAECGDGQHCVGVGHPVRGEHQGLPLPLAGPQGAVPSSRRVSETRTSLLTVPCKKCFEVLRHQREGALQQKSVVKLLYGA